MISAVVARPVVAVGKPLYIGHDPSMASPRVVQATVVAVGGPHSPSKSFDLQRPSTTSIGAVASIGARAPLPGANALTVSTALGGIYVDTHRSGPGKGLENL